jgi:predicted O-linked N-acetylglucosamine transferase (SPINDLY family)
MDKYQQRAEAAESLAQSGRWHEASKAYADLVKAGGSSFPIHFYYGTALMHGGQNEAAQEQLCAALRFNPDSPEALTNLAAVQGKLGQLSTTEETCRRILENQPHSPGAWINLCLSLCQQARVLEAIEAAQDALEKVPGDPALRDILLFSLNLIATEGRDLADVHRMLCAGMPAAPQKPLPDTTNRRIRIGYVSNDFRSHPVSSFMFGIIAAHDRSAFDVYCYSTTSAPDARTENFRQMAEHFVDLSASSDAETARHIEANQIDILVDLGGHTSGNRLPVFALRPAPVQATYLGYPATTGCSFIDFRVVDARTDPEGSEPFSTERLVRVPAPFLYFYPHFTYPSTAPCPALASGHITFGSFNQAPKISDDTLDLWSRVLTAVPNSQLFIKAQAFSDKTVCHRFRERFQQRGIHPSRLTLSGFLKGAQEHLAAYDKVDIALDTFPYNGTTTTCEALWMGVPVITLVGDLHAARVGYTLLAAVGLDRFAATSVEDYVAIAAALSKDHKQLADLRSSLQKAVMRSPLCDPIRLTKGLEDGYRKMLIG